MFKVRSPMPGAGHLAVWVCLGLLSFATVGPEGVTQEQTEKASIKAIYIPLADHYAAVVAYEKYAKEMKQADFTIERMKSWPLLRAYFMSGEVDLAFIICPQAMDMFREKPNFRWVSLMHRDGNALAINDLLNAEVKLPKERLERKPDGKVADAFFSARKKLDQPVECGVPHLHATHTVILYKYLKEHGRTLALGRGRDEDVVALPVPPPKSPAFIKKHDSRGVPAAFEQSLPWADVVETRAFGHVAWYSKDVLPWPKGHVECIAIATDDCIQNKKEALREVIRYIHKAGMDIEQARVTGGKEMVAISDMIRKHIPEHNREAIAQSLRPDLNVINYRNLNVDRNAKDGLAQIMKLAIESGVLKEGIDIDAFACTEFGSAVTGQPVERPGADHFEPSGDLTRATRQELQGQVSGLQKYASHPVMLEALRKQNAAGMTLEKIKAIDKAWQEGKQEAFAVSLQQNTVGRFLRNELLASEDVYSEAFLCDQQGAVVGEYPATSDYWQGDEEKFTACYNNGEGKVFVGPLEFDGSTWTHSVQISVPVNDKGKTIGVLVVGIKNIKQDKVKRK